MCNDLVAVGMVHTDLTNAIYYRVMECARRYCDDINPGYDTYADNTRMIGYWLVFVSARRILIKLVLCRVEDLPAVHVIFVTRATTQPCTASMDFSCIALKVLHLYMNSAHIFVPVERYQSVGMPYYRQCSFHACCFDRLYVLAGVFGVEKHGFSGGYLENSKHTQPLFVALRYRV